MKKVFGLLAVAAALAAGSGGLANAQYAYVANLGSNNVSVINLATNTVTTTLGVGTTPNGVAVNAAGTVAYVTNYSNASMSEINTATNAVTGTVTVGFSGYTPYAVAINPVANFAYVVGKSNDELTVVNTSNNTVAAVVAVESNPYGVAVTPNGATVYVTNYNGSTSAVGGTVSVINTNSNTVAATIMVGTNPEGVAVTPAGTAAYVANNDGGGAGTVSVINTDNLTVTTTVTVGNGPEGVAINPAGTLVFVANNTDNSVSVINTSTNAVTATIGVGNSPVSIAFNPAGTYAYVTNSGDNTVSVINTNTNAVTATIPVGNTPTGIAVGGSSLSINNGGFQNAGGFGAPPLAPGSLVDVYGNFPVNTAVANGAPWQTTLSGLSMQFNGVPAPFYFASAGQANVQVPWELAGQSQASVVAAAGGSSSAPQTMSLASAAPGIFTMNAQNQGAILDTSYNLVGSSNPATAGSSYILIYCTGLGPVTNQPATGSVASANPLSYATLNTTVTIGGIQVTPYFAGLAPGFIGMYQINVLVPAGVAASSTVPLFVSVGSAKSNTVTVAVQQ